MDGLLVAPITKIDKERREVWGYATLEVPDKTTPIPDVMDFASAVAAFAQWPGNVREMHLPVAVGKAVQVLPDPDKRGVYIGARISDSRDGQDVWQKIEEKILTSFSIGAKGITRTPETMKVDGKDVTVNRLRAKSIVEVSLVDNPACPGTQFSVAKLEEGLTGPTSQTGQTGLTPDSTKVDNDPNVGGGVDRDKLPASDFVDPARRRFPIVTAGDVSDAVSSYGRANPKIPFATFKRRLTAIATRKGFASALPKEWSDGSDKSDRSDGSDRFLTEAAKALLLAEVKKCDACDVHQALDVLHLLTALIDGEAMEQAMGSDEQDDLEQLRAAFELVQDFMSGELDEFLQAVPAATEAAAQMVQGPEETKMTQADVTKAVETAMIGVKTLLAEATKDLAGKADLTPLSENVQQATAAAEAVKTDLAALAKRVEKMEASPASGGPVLRTADVAGLTAVNKRTVTDGSAGEAVAQSATSILADIDKQIETERDPRKKETLGQLYTALAIKYRL